jgi:hypothetical protein
MKMLSIPLTCALLGCSILASMMDVLLSLMLALPLRTRPHGAAAALEQPGPTNIDHRLLNEDPRLLLIAPLKDLLRHGLRLHWTYVPGCFLTHISKYVSRHPFRCDKAFAASLVGAAARWTTRRM